MPARWRRVLGTTAAAFLIGSVALTGWELLIHHSLANARDRTTLWGGSVRRQSTRATGEPSQTKTSRVLPAPASGTRKQSGRFQEARAWEDEVDDDQDNSNSKRPAGHHQHDGHDDTNVDDDDADRDDDDADRRRMTTTTTSPPQLPPLP